MNHSERPLQVALIADFPEEQWESMNYVAEMLRHQFQHQPDLHVCLTDVTPRYRRIFGLLSQSRLAWNLDRLINRRIILPAGLRQNLRGRQFDMALTVDHSYAHVVPGVRRKLGRCLVICHDTDAIRPLNHPPEGMKNWLYQKFATGILQGLLAADQVTTVTQAVRQDLIENHGIDPRRVQVVPNGIATEFQPEANHHDERISGIIGQSHPVLVHVGSVIPRKRIDLLIRIISQLKPFYPDLICLRAGGQMTQSQRHLAESLQVMPHFRELPRLSRGELAAVYRMASVVVIPSDAEGFGLPMVEALACGARVVASDLPVLREVGGPFAEYAMPGDCPEFVHKIRSELDSVRNLTKRTSHPEGQEARSDYLKKFQWPETARRLAEILHEMKREQFKTG
jgi:glycosyltransferase involved in cell wall biosynthesis